jgi:hypothetical protein
MRKTIFASLLALAGLLTAANSASAQVVYYSSGYTPYYSYPSYYGSTMYTTPTVSSYYPVAPVVTPSGVVTSSYYAPSTSVVTPSYYMPTYTYPYSYGYTPYYSGYYTRGWGWRRY